MENLKADFNSKKSQAMELIVTLSKKIKDFGDAETINYGHIGSLSHVVEELERLDEFMGGDDNVDQTMVDNRKTEVVKELNSFFESLEMDLARYNVESGDGECEATGFGFYETGIRNVTRMFKQFRKTSKHFKETELLVVDNMAFRIQK
jgi:hypothetical protein